MNEYTLHRSLDVSTPKDISVAQLQEHLPHAKELLRDFKKKIIDQVAPGLKTDAVPLSTRDTGASLSESISPRPRPYFEPFNDPYQYPGYPQ